MNLNANRSFGDRMFDIFNVIFFSFMVILVMYPIYFMVIASISNPDQVYVGNVWLWPKELTMAGYQRIFEYDRIWLGYRNTILYAVVGTTINVVLTITGGYALSRRDMPGTTFMMIAIVMTMFFGGGLIPTYLLVRSLGMLDTMWAVIIPQAVVAYHVIVTRTFFRMTIPDELLEAAVMDGCKDIRFFFSVVLPLSLPIIAVMALFNVVGHWNQYFQALVYLRDPNLHPLQLVLRDILIATELMDIMGDPEEAMELSRLGDLIRYGVVIISIIPMLILYPFLQRYFVKGVMIGSVKG